jgi:ATP-dependent Zn protease
LNDMARNLVLWLVIAAVLLTIFNNFSTETESGRLSYSDFVAEVQSGRIERVTVDGYTIEGVRQNGDRFETVRPAISENPVSSRPLRASHFVARSFIRVHPDDHGIHYGDQCGGTILFLLAHQW